MKTPDKPIDTRGHLFDGGVCTICRLPYGVWHGEGQPACRTKQAAELLEKYRKAIAAVRSGVTR